MPDQQTAITQINPERKIFQFPRKQEDYPIVSTMHGEQIVVPVRDYRRFRGEASYWQFLFLIMTGGLIAAVWMLATKPPVVVEKPLIVDRPVQVPVNTECKLMCK